MLPLILGGLSVAGSLIQSNQAKKAAQGAAAASQVDIDALDKKTREIAKKNALESAELERQLTPEVPQLREQANKAVMAGIPDDASTAANKSYLQSQVGQNVRSPLLEAAIARAKAELDMGGKLPTDVANLVASKAAAKAGTVAPGTLGLGKDITARDLGLTSLDLLNRRIDTAGNLGNMEANVGFSNASNLLNQIQLLKSISDSSFGRSLSAANYGQSIAQPVVGLDPGSVADVITGNATNKSAALSNQASIYGNSANNLMRFGGQLAGYGLAGMGGSPATSNPTAATPPYTSSYGINTGLKRLGSSTTYGS